MTDVRLTCAEGYTVIRLDYIADLNTRPVKSIFGLPNCLQRACCVDDRELDAIAFSAPMDLRQAEIR